MTIKMSNDEVFKQIVSRCKDDVYHSIRVLSGFWDYDQLLDFVSDIVSKLYPDESNS